MNNDIKMSFFWQSLEAICKVIYSARKEFYEKIREMKFKFNFGTSNSFDERDCLMDAKSELTGFQ